MADRYSPGSLWFYAPNGVAPIVYSCLFFLTGVAHAYQTIRYKSWRATVILPWGAALMTAGLILRALGARDTGNLPILIASQVLVLSGPPVYSAAAYFIFSRVLFYVPYLSPLHPGRVVSTFIGLDAVVEIMIAQGAWRMANPSLSPQERKVGEDLSKAALLLQAGVFIAFVSLVAWTHLQARRRGVLRTPLRTVLITMYVVSAMIFARCVYRVVEFFEGYTGNVYTHEEYFWVFDCSLMLIASLVLNVWHPGPRLPRDNSVFLSPEDGVTERHGPGWNDDRAWLLTVLDPFDLSSAIARRKPARFWEMSDAEIAQLEADRRASKRPWYAAVIDPLGCIWGPTAVNTHSKRSERSAPIDRNESGEFSKHGMHQQKNNKYEEAV